MPCEQAISSVCLVYSQNETLLSSFHQRFLEQNRTIPVHSEFLIPPLFSSKVDLSCSNHHAASYMVSFYLPTPVAKISERLRLGWFKVLWFFEGARETRFVYNTLVLNAAWKCTKQTDLEYEDEVCLVNTTLKLLVMAPSSKSLPCAQAWAARHVRLSSTLKYVFLAWDW